LTPQWVIDASGGAICSQPLFLDPSMDAMSKPSTGESALVVPIRYDDYLMERPDKKYQSRGKAAAEQVCA